MEGEGEGEKKKERRREKDMEKEMYVRSNEAINVRSFFRYLGGD